MTPVLFDLLILRLLQGCQVALSTHSLERDDGNDEHVDGQHGTHEHDAADADLLTHLRVRHKVSEENEMIENTQEPDFIHELYLASHRLFIRQHIVQVDYVQH